MNQIERKKRLGHPGWGVVNVIKLLLLVATESLTPQMCLGVHIGVKVAQYYEKEEPLNRLFSTSHRNLHLWNQTFSAVSIVVEKPIKINVTFEQLWPCVDCFCFEQDQASVKEESQFISNVCSCNGKLHLQTLYFPLSVPA